MRVLLAVHNAYADPTSGAARSVRTLMRWLAGAGYSCRVLATTRFDARPPATAEDRLESLGVPLKWGSVEGRAGREVARFDLEGLAVETLVTAQDPPEEVRRAESRRFLALLDRAVGDFAPDLLLTYGAHPAVLAALRRARARGVATMVYLCSYGYEHREYFRDVGHVLLDSPYLGRHYRAAIGLRAEGLCAPIDWSEVMATEGGREFVTFVNPSPHKGAALFARLAQVLGAERPDVPLLVIRSASDGEALARYPGLAPGALSRVVAGPPARTPSEFLALTKILLVPSVFAEPFGRVAVEAMINGIPPVVSDRGALPETVAGSGRVVPLPSWMTPSSRVLPIAEEVAPWVRAILGLWDDPALYAKASADARRAAETHYSEAVVRPRFLARIEAARGPVALFPPDPLAPSEQPAEELP